ncbi:LysR family transcriptional regulator [Vibrio maerlii]|uniref:LysR family transcriptional regulator n=1 Tax=Vibrio maerlii TaxID=2231648 RepID=UPI000E3CACC8|nr:LysR family transcriptional regulator [Vibrio maerlii]
MNLAQIDLNLLVILKHLLEEKHVSNTALALDMSQPTVSRSLQKLRNVFNDDLLVRTAYGYELTPKAESIKQDLNSVLTRLEKLVHGDTFNPAESDTTVRFFGLVPQMTHLMPKVMEHIRREAPNMVVDIDSIPKRPFEPLLSGDVHFVLATHEPTASEQNLYRMFVTSRDYRLLMHKNHPLADKEITVEDMLEANFGQISIQGDKKLSIESRFKELGLINKERKLSVPVQLSNFNVAPDIAETTDIIFHLPTPFAEKACSQRDLVCKRVPEPLRHPEKDVYLYWHKRFHNDPMCRWIRDVFKQTYPQ